MASTRRVAMFARLFVRCLLLLGELPVRAEASSWLNSSSIAGRDRRMCASCGYIQAVPASVEAMIWDQGWQQSINDIYHGYIS
jgi:hypothetical protein